MALTKFNFNSFDVTSAASTGLGFNSSANGFSTFNPGAMTLIKTITASSDSTISFVDGSSSVVLDNTYPIYMFKYISCHPSTGAGFRLNFSADGGSNYNVTKTSTTFVGYHREDDSQAVLTYRTQDDLAQGTGVQHLTGSDIVGDDNDQSISGEMFLFNPSSTTFVKHFIARSNFYGASDFSMNFFAAGYCNTTSAIDGVQFTMSTGNIDSGTIKLYGIKDS